ncbi:hypothetical protein NX059_007795 [Plenodomus lindquistii]|nr:hypothetical protein NX059_007795 [Plenodomus lindquistii]
MMQGTMSLGAPVSRRRDPRAIGSAAMMWCCSRRGRWMVGMTAFLGVFLVLTAMKHQEVLSSQYRSLSAHYPWRPYLPTLPSIVHSPFKTPSNKTLDIESGKVNHLPSKLKKTTPNFHLLMPTVHDTEGFCKTTLSAMLLDYPPPTTVNMLNGAKSEKDGETDWGFHTLNRTLSYLSNKRLVKDEDLVLIVDGQQTWFQLPSDVIVTQYKRLLEDANWRLLAKYGVNADGYQKFNQTIVFGAEKMCVGDDMACRYVPHSILPDNMYGEEEDAHRIADMPAKFINSRMAMGPAKDLRILYAAALKKFQNGKNHSQTLQSIFATIFGEQQLRRDAVGPKPTTSRLKMFFGGSNKKATSEQAAAKLPEGAQHEFSIGLDYLHILFQPLLYCTEDELVSARHDNSTDLSVYRHPGSVYQRLTLPAALDGIHPPFWRHNFAKHNPSPNEKPSYVDPLEFDAVLDSLPKRNTPWSKVRLIQNTYTGAVPAILMDNTAQYLGSQQPSVANVTWSDLWFFPYKRALLRNYFRTPQSPAGYHNSLVGGDRTWDTRGGRGGVWTASTGTWLPWGEADGVCGSLQQIKAVFEDGRGVWMHENEFNNEGTRLQEEKNVADEIKEREHKWQRIIEEEKQREKFEKEEEERRKKDKEEEEEKERKKLEEEKEKERLEEEKEKEKLEDSQKSNDDADEDQDPDAEATSDNNENDNDNEEETPPSPEEQSYRDAMEHQASEDSAHNEEEAERQRQAAEKKVHDVFIKEDKEVQTAKTVKATKAAENDGDEPISEEEARQAAAAAAALKEEEEKEDEKAKRRIARRWVS